MLLFSENDTLSEVNNSRELDINSLSLWPAVDTTNLQKVLELEIFLPHFPMSSLFMLIL